MLQLGHDVQFLVRTISRYKSSAHSYRVKRFESTMTQRYDNAAIIKACRMKCPVVRKLGSVLGGNTEIIVTAPSVVFYGHRYADEVKVAEMGIVNA